MVVVSLDATARFAPVEGANGPFADTITIRPDAITENRSRPCRELNYHRTPNHQRPHSRFGECCIATSKIRVTSLRHHSATAKLIQATSSRIGNCISGD
jgi:hypothetical protein